MSLVARKLEPEWLDELPASAPEAVHSRGDLRRLNGLMGSVRLLAATARELELPPPRTIVELACGDGLLLRQLLERTAWRPERLILLDRQPVVTEETLAQLRRFSSRLEVVTADVFDWLGTEATPSVDLITTNLFLHHFEDDRLRTLLKLVAAKSSVFIACEPERSVFALCTTKLIGLIGCNHVTRHDAAISVKAGFRADELSRLWPADPIWTCREQPRGLFSHCFGTRKTSGSS